MDAGHVPNEFGFAPLQKFRAGRGCEMRQPSFVADWPAGDWQSRGIDFGPAASLLDALDAAEETCPVTIERTAGPMNPSASSASHGRFARFAEFYPFYLAEHMLLGRIRF